MRHSMRESVEMKNGVTERRGADAALRWNEERYRALIATSALARKRALCQPERQYGLVTNDAVSTDAARGGSGRTGAIAKRQTRCSVLHSGAASHGIASHTMIKMRSVALSTREQPTTRRARRTRGEFHP
jgi:hypothetical protein